MRPEPPTAEERAERLLTTALDRLAGSPVVHYKGRYDTPSGATNVDLRISGSGIAYGTMSDAGTKLRVLTLQDRTFIRAGASFWSSSASAAGVDPKLKSQLVKRYAASWVSADAKDIGDPAATLRPAGLARQFGQQLRKTGVSNVRSGTLDGKPVSIISVGFTNYYVGTASPNQLLAVEKPRIEAADRATRGALRDEGDDAPDDDSLEFDELDPPAVDDFYDGVQDEAKRNLPKAIDSQVNFNTRLAGGINCPFGSGNCTVTANVSNAVSTGDRNTTATGTVQADMTVFATGPSNSTTCTDSKSMPVNSSTTMSCVARLVLPACNKRGGVCTWPVTANILVLARANVNVSKLLEDLGRDRSKAEQQVKCQLSRSCPAVLDDSMKGIRASEQATAKRLADRPEFSGRTFRKPKNGEADWEDDLGRTYDALGDGTKSQYFRWEQFRKSLDHHLTKSYDFTVLDMTGYTPGQIGLVKAYLSALPDRIKSRMTTRLITIGM